MVETSQEISNGGPEDFTGAGKALAAAGRAEVAAARADLIRTEAAASGEALPGVLQGLIWQRTDFPKIATPELTPEAGHDILAVENRLARALIENKLYLEPQGKEVAQLNDEVRDELKALGLHGFLIPRQYGGREHGFDALLKLFEGGARNGGFHVIAITSASVVIGPAMPVLLYGTEAQRQLILPAIARGADGFFALTQHNAGVNVSGMGATGALRDGVYLLNATRDPSGDPQRDHRKWYASGADYGKSGVVVVRNADAPKSRLMFVIDLPEHDTDTFSLHRYALSAFATIPNNGIELRDFPISPDRLIPCDGMKALFANLNNGRAALGAMYSGLFDFIIGQSSHWIRDRLTVGNEPFQIGATNTVHSLGRMAALSCGVKAITEFTAASIREGRNTALESIVTKWFVGWAAREVQDSAQDIFGGRMFQPNHPVGRYNSDLLVARTFEGPNPALANKLFDDLTDEHVTSRLDPLQDILDKYGIDRVDLGSLGGMRVMLSMLMRKDGRALMEWSASQEAKRLVNAAKAPLHFEVPDAIPESLRDSARFAMDTLHDWPRWATNQMRQFGKALLDNNPMVEQMAERVILATVIAATAQWAAGKDPTIVRSCELLCDHLKDKIQGHCDDYFARTTDGIALGHDILANKFEYSRNVIRARELD